MWQADKYLTLNVWYCDMGDGHCTEVAILVLLDVESLRPTPAEYVLWLSGFLFLKFWKGSNSALISSCKANYGIICIKWREGVVCFNKEFHLRSKADFYFILSEMASTISVHNWTLKLWSPHVFLTMTLLWIHQQCCHTMCWNNI